MQIDPYQRDPYSRPKQASSRNGLGIAGFVLSLVGLLCCSGVILSPLGLTLSLIALSRPPRGFAVTGVILGTLGVLAGLFMYAALAVQAKTYGGWSNMAEVWMDTIEFAEAIENYNTRTSSVPTSIDELKGLTTDARTDPWGRPYRLSFDQQGTPVFVVSDGPDGIADTPDDIEEALELAWP